jgi:hypothetical protein
VLYTLMRMRVREAVSPAEGKGRFASLLRTSPFFTRMATRAANRPRPAQTLDRGQDKGADIR